MFNISPLVALMECTALLLSEYMHVHENAVLRSTGQSGDAKFIVFNVRALLTLPPEKMDPHAMDVH